MSTMERQWGSVIICAPPPPMRQCRYTACIQPYNPSCCTGRPSPTSRKCRMVLQVKTYLQPPPLVLSMSLCQHLARISVPPYLIYSEVQFPFPFTCSLFRVVEVAMPYSRIRQVNYNSSWIIVLLENHYSLS
jgi:hypothetical protein